MFWKMMTFGTCKLSLIVLHPFIHVTLSVIDTYFWEREMTITKAKVFG
jgi:hypothetical protein